MEEAIFESWFEYLIETFPDLGLYNEKAFRESNEFELIQFCFLSGLTLGKNESYNKWLSEQEFSGRHVTRVHN